MLGRKKQLVFTLVIVLFVPVLLLLLELVLRLAGAGYDTRPFLQHPTVPEAWVDNPQYYCKYYPDFTGRVPMPVRNVFQYRKPADTLRGFVIGESTAEGFPFNSNLSFSKILERSLGQAAAYKKVEVINLGVSAMASYFTKDAALKVLDYQPDFIIIYGGHNEVYGTLSYTTGGNYLTKSLYLNLKELRIFQLFYDLMGAPARKPDNKQTLMANQFRNRYVASTPAADGAVAADYLRNIERVVSEYDKRGIPVIIVEPVSNLTDMPPFAGTDDDKFKPFIQQYMQILQAGDPAAAKAFWEERQTHREYDANANVAYLDAICRAKYFQDFNLELGIKAKDLDTVPFRMRSASIDALRGFVKDKSAAYPRLHYVPTSDLLSRQYGGGIFSNRIFIDQLHFNFLGQVIIAGLLSQEVVKDFGFGEGDREKVAAYFKDGQAIKQDVSLLPYYEMEAYWRISTITSDEPFTSMLIPYRLPPFAELFPGNSIIENPFLRGHAEKEFGAPDFYRNLMDYYAGQKNDATVLAYRQAAVRLFPADPVAYRDLATSLAAQDGKEDQAVQNLIAAWRFSGLKQEYWAALSAYLTGINRADQLDSLKTTYGNPR